jgi:hypothetical protein
MGQSHVSAGPSDGFVGRRPGPEAKHPNLLRDVLFHRVSQRTRCTTNGLRPGGTDGCERISGIDKKGKREWEPLSRTSESRQSDSSAGPAGCQEGACKMSNRREPWCHSGEAEHRVIPAQHELRRGERGPRLQLLQKAAGDSNEVPRRAASPDRGGPRQERWAGAAQRLVPQADQCPPLSSFITSWSEVLPSRAFSKASSTKVFMPKRRA